ncbi:MAG TPA: hypothetical protein DCR46_03630 [Cytophagales bacterium]|nr:hypothetical protein [Cytophagales bacterium]
MGAIPEIIDAKSVSKVSIGIFTSAVFNVSVLTGAFGASLGLVFSLHPEMTRIDILKLIIILAKRNFRIAIIIFWVAKINFINSNCK